MGSLGLSSGAPLLESREKRLHWELSGFPLSLSRFSCLCFIFSVARWYSVITTQYSGGAVDNASYRFPVLGLYFVLYTKGFVFALAKGVGTTTLRD